MFAQKMRDNFESYVKLDISRVLRTHRHTGEKLQYDYTQQGRDGSINYRG